ncbi:GAF domain-containing hybrid sensor histidine kinase/response regulator [Segetibacter koreensis]|uniref:GAF domain-containing hybrid sensor histidine kinase/response regulator n=1 Tax=Segetibacter koreensis TaxID=398037 RepID=UPI0003714CA3|nr:GAF domain-containing hybrid sensor histidine kinase/response regulator [Segetibacter koreensis]
MKKAPLALNEEMRLKELYSLAILDTENETDFDELVQLASYICQCDISSMTLIDKHRQWFKAKKGISETETPIEFSFCAHAILEKEVFIIEDARADDRFFDNPSVSNGHIRFYAGAAIQSENNFPVGTICVADSKPKKLTKEQIDILSSLARHASTLLELKRKNKLLKELAIEQQLLKEKAEKASKAQEQFLSTMSHEIRTPLNGVIGMIDLLSQNSPRPDQVHDIDFLKSASANLLHIVNDILDYNKIESGNLKIEKTAFNIYEVISEIEKIHQLKAKQKAIHFTTFIDSRLPTMVMGDPTRIKQVLNNITDNAIKFTEKGSVKIDVELYNKDTDTLSLLFKVTDTGIGIEADKLTNIFERFFQANSNTTRIYGGTGLGLAITKKILELMNSQIRVDTTKDLGSCFSFILTVENVKPETTYSSSPISGTGKESKLRNLKVLVAEDNKMNKVLIERFLKKWEVNADFAINGLEAIDKVSKEDYDLILMDLQMPEMDGYEATKYIRQELKKTLPIIAMTADALFNSDNHINTFGLTDYVLKPFNPTTLSTKIFEYAFRAK